MYVLSDDEQTLVLMQIMYRYQVAGTWYSSTEYTRFPSGTRLGEWRKGLLKKSAQHLSDEEAYNIPVRIASYHKIDRYIPTAVLGPNIGKSFNLGPLYIQGP